MPTKPWLTPNQEAVFKREWLRGRSLKRIAETVGLIDFFEGDIERATTYLKNRRKKLHLPPRKIRGAVRRSVMVHISLEEHAIAIRRANFEGMSLAKYVGNLIKRDIGQ